MRTRQQITLHLDPALITALDAEAGKRGLTASRAANDLLRRALIEEGTEQLADMVIWSSPGSIVLTAATAPARENWRY